MAEILDHVLVTVKEKGKAEVQYKCVDRGTGVSPLGILNLVLDEYETLYIPIGNLEYYKYKKVMKQIRSN